jgi:hypothetical protein
MYASITFKMTDDLVRRQAKEKAARRAILLGVVMLLVFGAAAIVAISLGYPWWGLGLVAGGLVLWLLAGLLLSLLGASRAIAHWDQMAHRRVTLRLSEEGMDVTAPDGQAHHHWREFKKVTRGHGLWLLVVRGGVFYTVPIEALDEDAAGYIARKIRQSGGDVDRVG